MAAATTIGIAAGIAAGAATVQRQRMMNQKASATRQARALSEEARRRAERPGIDDKAVQQARASNLLRLQQRSGVASTNLSQNYTNNTFGG